MALKILVYGHAQITCCTCMVPANLHEMCWKMLFLSLVVREDLAVPGVCRADEVPDGSERCGTSLCLSLQERKEHAMGSCIPCDCT
jgi:hypothetical protein